LSLRGFRTEQFHDDYTTQSFTSCEVRVDELEASVVPASTKARMVHLQLSDRYAKSGCSTAEGSLLAARSTGFYIGATDDTTDPWTVLGISGGLDIVTSFGVKNLDFDHQQRPIWGHEETFEIGPQRITAKVLDVGNSNVRCDYVCRNVYDIEIRAEPLPNAPPEAMPTVLEYR
jgi:hypothetical protein